MSATGPPRLLVLWSAPRCRSTAFFRMMAERGDYVPVHEPFSYLAEFGRVELAGTTATSEQEVIATLRAAAGASPVFVKDTTDERYPGVVADASFLGRDATHTFLIRDPRDTIASYVALNPRVALPQIGFEALWELYEAVRRVTGRVPAVVDSDDLVARPEAVVASYCAHTGIPYRPDALTWQPGEHPAWAPTTRWHREAAASRGFRADVGRASLDVAGHPVLGSYLRHHAPYYERLRAVRLRP